MNKTVLGLAALGWIACTPANQAEPDLVTIIERHIEARGGREAVESVRSMSVELEIVEPEFTVTGSYVATREGWMRIDVFAGGERVFTEALGPDGGWQMHADGVPLDLSPEGEAALRRGVYGNLYGLHELSDLGYELTLVGQTERGGRSLWEIEQTAPDGFSKHAFLDAETFLDWGEVKTAALHPDVDPTEARQETRVIEHSEAEGIWFPNRMKKIDLDSGDLLQEATITARQLNPPIDPSRFLRPEPEQG